MNKEFVDYQIALDMKSIDFDEPCFGYYINNEFHFFADLRNCNTNSEFKLYPTAPTFSQCFKWFREKHKLHSNIPQSGDMDDRYTFRIYDTFYPHTTVGRGNEYSYPEAELACLLYLIKIVKNK